MNLSEHIHDRLDERLGGRLKTDLAIDARRAASTTSWVTSPMRGAGDMHDVEASVRRRRLLAVMTPAASACMLAVRVAALPFACAVVAQPVIRSWGRGHT